MVEMEKARTQLDRARGRRDDAIRAAHKQGLTVRAIATELGLASARVHQILHGR